MFDFDLADKPVNVNDGEWVGDLPSHPGVKFRVRSNAYKPFEVAHNRLLRSFGKRAAQAYTTPEYQKGLGALLAEHILLDWENAVSREGAQQPYSKELAVQVLTSIDERGMGKTFREAVAYAAGVVADRHIGLVDEIAGE